MQAKLDEILEREIWKTYGAISTPVEIVDLMLQLSGIEKWEGLKILEPGCGLCDFMARIYSEYPKNHFTGIEVNPEIYNIARSLHPQFNLVLSDFLLWEVRAEYDIVIGNPPYGIIGDKSHYPIHALNEKKPLYKKLTTTWFGKYNIYGAFIEKGLRVLKNGGKLVYIVPATFMILDDFKILRKFLSASGRVKVFYLGADIFGGKNVSTCILVIDKGLKGIEVYEVQELKRIVRFYEKTDYKGEIIRFETPETKAFEEGAIALGAVFSMHFAARSPEVRKHPLVSQKAETGLVPVLTGRNLHPGWIDYGHCYSGLWMPKEAAPSLRRFYGFPHLVVGHTKGGKVVAALDKDCYPWREEIHLIPKVEGLDLDAVAQYLNSEQVQEYMRRLYKNITPHITITQLRQLPIRIPDDDSFRTLTLI